MQWLHKCAGSDVQICLWTPGSKQKDTRMSIISHFLWFNDLIRFLFFFIKNRYLINLVIQTYVLYFKLRSKDDHYFTCSLAEYSYLAFAD